MSKRHRSSVDIDYKQYLNGPLAEGLAGVDEAGRGPLAGPVVAAAVILDPQQPIPGLNDSKKLTSNQRNKLYSTITTSALAYSFGIASVAEIEKINILQASLLAMQRAINSLKVEPKVVWIDGIYCPDVSYPCYALIKGDSKIMAISAASILAKVYRDRQMLDYDSKYPEYGFAQHKGYPTAAHIEALNNHGPCEIHRRTYAPVKQCIANLVRKEGVCDV